MLTERVDALVGSILGKDYLVLEPIGAGGMAVVYLVEHQTLHKRFAAKVLSTELAANQEARARFIQEAHAASSLDHENIINISDLGVTNDQRPYFVMELLRGQTLHQRIVEGPMTLEEIVAISVSVGRALAYAHAEGIVHRDVKPENVVLVQRSQGRWGVKVVDFGIAKAPVDVRITKMGQVLGTPMYMAPEACRGDDVDHRADIYSFGILLYQMLCGRLPFEDENVLKLLQMQLTTPLPPPRTVNPELSPELAAILERALEKDVDARFPTMDALISALDAALPPGADRLLMDLRNGVVSARTTPFPSSSGASSSRPSLPRIQPAADAATRATAESPAVTITSRAASVGESTAKASTEQPTRKRPWVFAAAAVAVGGAIAAFLLLRPTDPAAQPTATAAASEPVDPRAPPIAPPVAVAKPSPPPPPPPPPPPVPMVVQLRVASQPAGAQVRLDGVAIGTTPFERALDKLDRSGRLVVSTPGYDDVEQTIDLRVGGSIEVVLPARAKTVKRTPVITPRVRDKGRGSNAGSATPTRGDPNLDIRLSR